MDHVLPLIERRLTAMAARPVDDAPVYTEQGKWIGQQRHAAPWASGFPAGLLWQWARSAGDDPWREHAQRHTAALLDRAASSHDPGFGLALFVGALPAYEASRDGAIQSTIIDAARRVADSYFPRGGFFAAAADAAPTLHIEQIAGLPLVFYAACETLDQDLARFALSHARATRRHLIDGQAMPREAARFDRSSGQVEQYETQHAGSDSRYWTRGLAWSMWGYARIYALTDIREMLSVAEQQADQWLSRFADEPVPPWVVPAGKAAPDSGHQPRDASAAAIAASALLDLAGLTRDEQAATRYRAAADRLLQVLTSPDYLAPDSSEWEGILRHAVYDPVRSLGVDESVIWGDYFLVEAVLKTR